MNRFWRTEKTLSAALEIRLLACPEIEEGPGLLIRLSPVQRIHLGWSENKFADLIEIKAAADPLDIDSDGLLARNGDQRK